MKLKYVTWQTNLKVLMKTAKLCPAIENQLMLMKQGPVGTPIVDASPRSLASLFLDLPIA